MPSRFYFHLVRGQERVIDRAGIKVRREELMSPAALDKVKERWPGTADLDDWEGWSVEIVDAQGDIVRTVALP